LTFKLDHFLCYSIEPQGTFRARSVVVSDQFGKTKVVAVKPESLCTPASKNEGPVLDERAHLLCYSLKVPRTFRAPVTIANQLDKAKFTAYRLASLCLPTGKSLSFEVTPPVPKKLGHYSCYLIKAAAPPERDVSVTDQFLRDPQKFALTRRLRVCNPAVKVRAGVTSPILNRRDHLVCYSLEGDAQFEQQRVLVRNQFGKMALTVVTPRTLCIPSLKRKLS